MKKITLEDIEKNACRLYALIKDRIRKIVGCIADCLKICCAFLYGRVLCVICLALLMATIVSPLCLHYDANDKQLKPRKTIAVILSRACHSLCGSPGKEPGKKNQSPNKSPDENEGGKAGLQSKQQVPEEAGNEEASEKDELVEIVSVLRNEMKSSPNRQTVSKEEKNENRSYQLKVDPLAFLTDSNKKDKPFNIEFTKPKEEHFSLYKNFDAVMFFVVYVLSITLFTILTVISLKGLHRQEKYRLFKRGKKEFWLMMKTSADRKPYQEQFMQEMMRLYFNKKEE